MRLTGRESDMYCRKVFDLALPSFICCACSWMILSGGRRGVVVSCRTSPSINDPLVVDTDFRIECGVLLSVWRKLTDLALLYDAALLRPSLDLILILLCSIYTDACHPHGLVLMSQTVFYCMHPHTVNDDRYRYVIQGMVGIIHYQRWLCWTVKQWIPEVPYASVL